MTLKDVFEARIAEVSDLVDTYPFEDKYAAHRFFSQQYYLIQNSTRYEAIGASLLPLDLKEEFRHRILHLTGEFNHDDLIIEDLEKMGFKELEPLYPQTRALIACTYHELQTRGADALFGISLLLEGLSTRQCDKVARRLQKQFGFDPQYLRVHDEADAVHYPETMSMVMAYGPERQRVILDNLELSACLYKLIIHTCHERSELRSRLSA